MSNFKWNICVFCFKALFFFSKLSNKFFYIRLCNVVDLKYIVFHFIVNQRRNKMMTPNRLNENDDRECKKNI